MVKPATSWRRLTFRTATPGARARENVRAADLLPKDIQAQVKAGQFLLYSQQFEDAKTRAHHALALDRKNVEAQILLANSLAGLKDLDGAIEEIEEAIRLDPRHRWAMRALARCNRRRTTTRPKRRC